jgi:N-dimethylarginine dimethylaminohydrolase
MSQENPGNQINLPSSKHLPVVNSHDSWSALQEVWLGDVYPASWYDHLQPEVRDIFYQLTEITQTDLAHIQRVLESRGITVQRPRYDCIDDYVRNDNLIKPEICPRDRYLVVGNNLLVPYNDSAAWQHTYQHYESDHRCKVIRGGGSHIINGANVVRVGRDIIIDRDCFDFEYDNRFPDYRVQVVANGGHLDGCFAILRPGLILANHYFDDYERTFPGWEIIMLDDPTYAAAPSRGYQQPYPVYNGKFWNTTVGTNRMFNQHIIDHALDWVGCYTETYFELNCLVLDPNNVVMLAENHRLAETLNQHGITVHWVPFRARSFWDGAMHCLTVDIRRDSGIQDYFPERSS